jgi:hypothetical protein
MDYEFIDHSETRTKVFFSTPNSGGEKRAVAIHRVLLGCGM